MLIISSNFINDLLHFLQEMLKAFNKQINYV